MASSCGKTIMDLFKQPAAKRLKRVSSPPQSPASAAVSSFSSAASRSPDDGQGEENGVVSQTGSLTPEQILKIEFNKSLAKAKLNLNRCAEKVTNSISKGEGMQHVKLKELLVEESWLQALPGEFEKPYAKNLCKFVESEICSAGVPIYPPQHLLFNALNTTSIDKVKAVIIGQDPYHGPGQAMGLSFSVPEGVKVPSSLVNIYKELKQDLGCSIPSHGNLEKWAIQGVLLLNAVLTVRHHQANSHANKGWEQFTDDVIRAISQKKKGVVFLLWGNYAQAKGRLIDETKHHVLKSAHPSGLSANRGFFGCRHFSKTNKLMEEMGKPPIDWQL
ncbi:unnamed protein product [Cuscuta campestris]|uniref:Uracil-DNA glycosylase n=1 Tax=Cuscuta campestris TaxID=132261 RepID=A0A484L3E4_9ASTE|nr:unnamed protein product [Cuscuta campestris]